MPERFPLICQGDSYIYSVSNLLKMSEMKTNYCIASEKLILVKLQRCALHLNRFVCTGFICVMDDLTWEFWIIVYTRIETGVYLVVCPLNLGICVDFHT